MKAYPQDSHLAGQRAHTAACNKQVSFRQAVTKLAVLRGITLVTEDDASLAATSMSYLVDAVIDHCDWNVRSLADAEYRVTWLLMQATAERLAQFLDCDSKLVTLYASMWIYRHDPAYVFGDDIKRMASALHGLKADETLRLQYVLLMNSIDAWLAGSDLADTSRVARVAALLAGQRTRLVSIKEQD
jgi:hypothetical protein